jgi:hypothetical protein
LLAFLEIWMPSANLYLPFAMNEQLNTQEIMKSNGLYVFVNSLDDPCPFMQIWPTRKKNPSCLLHNSSDEQLELVHGGFFVILHMVVHGPFQRQFQK